MKQIYSFSAFWRIENDYITIMSIYCKLPKTKEDLN
jgi:hypothetical protein